MPRDQDGEKAATAGQREIGGFCTQTSRIVPEQTSREGAAAECRNAAEHADERAQACCGGPPPMCGVIRLRVQRH